MKKNLRIVTLALAISLLAGFGARAQAPGGVSSGLRVWLRSDNGFSPSSWTDQSGNANHYTQTNATRQPFVAASQYNFNPIIDFGTTGNDGRFMVLPAGKPYSANGTSSSVFTVNLDRGVGGYADILGFGATTTTTSLINANSPVFTRLGAKVVNYPYSDSNPALPAVAVNKLYLNDVSFTVGTAGIKYGQNGMTAANTQTFTAGNAKHADGSILGSQPEVRNGLIGEVIAYERDLTEIEKQRVRTYTAIKYGVSLPHNYIASNGTTVFWNQTTNTSYNNNIAGIARDDNGALHQKQSRSINDGKQVLIGTAGLANTNVLNTTELTDGQFLVWGDNGLPKTPSVTANDLGASVNSRFASIWKVQNVGTVGVVRVAWPKGLSNLQLIQSADNVIGAGDVATAMSAETAPINGIVYNYVDVRLADGAYFTFAAFVKSPGGVHSALWFRADKGLTPITGAVTSWTEHSYGSVSVVSNLTSTTSAPTGVTAVGNSLNFNPGITFTAANALGNGSALNALTALNYSIFTATTKVTGGGFDRILGLSPSTATGGYKYDAPGIGTALLTWRRADNSFASNSYDADAYRYSTLSNTSIVRNTFTPTTFDRAINGGVIGANKTVSNPSVPLGGILFGRNANDGGDDNGVGMTMTEAIIVDGALTANEVNRIESYLAIKGGITLNPAVTPNYLSSASTSVWTGANNTGYQNNIAGLGRDDLSDLNQKQSRSINDGQQVLIGTTGLTNTNGENGIDLIEGQYLIWGDNGLSKSLSAAYTGTVGTTTLNLRFAAVWKVQNTGAVGSVRVTWPAGVPSLHLIQSGDAIFDNSDTKTDMTGNTATVNGVSYNYADVTLTNGQYFTFAGFLSGPGNVASSAWYRADAPGQQFSDAGVNAATDGQTLQQWNEFKGTGYNLVQATSGNRPTFSNTTTLANFNPTVTFPGSQWMRYIAPAGVNVIDRANGSIYAAGYMNSVGAAGIAGFDDTMDFPGLHTSQATGGNRGLLFFTSGGPGYQGTSANNFTNKSYFTIGSGWQNGEGSPTATYAGATVSLNGNRTVYAGTNQINNVNLNAAYRDFRIGQDVGYGQLNGQLNEVVVFDQRLSEDEMNRVETYMAIKYGSTYAAGARNYVNSSNGIVWAAASHDGHHNNIAGVARDDMGSLYQKQSWSTNAGKQVLISTTGLGNTNAANGGSLANGQFLIWGDNNLAKAPTVAISGMSGNVNYRFAAIWKAQNTNGVGTVRVAWPKGLTNLKLIQSGDVTINSSDVITDMAGTQTVNGVDYAYADVTIDNGQYFTFAAYIQAPGGVTNGLSHWYRADKLTESTGDGTDVTSWTDFTSGVVSSQLGAAALPKYKEGNTTYLNFNPGLNFTASNQTIGNIELQTLTSLNFDVFTLTKEGMSGSRFFNIGRDNTTLTGTNWDQPGFYTDGGIARRDNTGGLPFLGTPTGSPAFGANAPNIMYHTFTNTTLSKGRNGAANGTGSTHGAISAVTGGHMFGANNVGGTGGDDGGFIGNIGELVIYGNGTITAPERNKVDSYLAIKYGVTLNNTNNYTTSGGVVVWDKDANLAHYNNVAGIGNDLVSALHQKQSRSQHTNTNNQVIIGLGDIAATNVANTNSLNDGQFLVWGDNGNTTAMTNAASTYTAFSFSGGTDNARRMNRVWKVQNTGITNEVLVRFPVISVGNAPFPPAIDACAQFVLLTASDAGFTTNVVATPLMLNDDDYDLLTSFPIGASYFTFAKATPISSGVVYLPSVVETTTETSAICGIPTAWTYFRKTGDPSLKLLATSGVTTTTLTATVTPEGATYDDGARITKLMPRIATVTDAAAGPYSGVKVRVYYSQDELNNTTVAGAGSSGWYKFEGDADAAIADVSVDGLLNPTIATALTPQVTGVEDGVRYAEFHGISSFGSFIYVSTTESSALPVTLAYFNASKNENKTVLNWTTTSEKNSQSFHIERSTDAKGWNTIGRVTSAGESVSVNTYNYDDLTPLSGINYYRLKMVDMDNTFAYSSIRSVRMDGVAGVVLYPNPVSSRLMFKDVKAETVNKVLVYDNFGRVHLEVNKIPADGINVAGLPVGIYVVVLKMQDGSASRHKITVQK